MSVNYVTLPLDHQSVSEQFNFHTNPKIHKKITHLSGLE